MRNNTDLTNATFATQINNRTNSISVKFMPSNVTRHDHFECAKTAATREVSRSAEW